MGLLIRKTDFTGKYELPTGLFDKLDTYISLYEKVYLRKLMGVTYFEAFEADVDSSTFLPVSAEYLAIYEPFAEDEGNCIIESQGMKNMLLGFIYFEYVRDFKYKMTEAGPSVAAIETGREASWTEFPLEGRYTESVKTAQAIQWKMMDDPATYPDYNGQQFKLSHWAL